ncbi:hypothetical protein CRE_14763 [Caenorhabditis remanei]|uniref:F-box domain-containing protein n=1 Tax=Caenorhabditis remanei TaxID=31234 RepID=E3MRS5_CAERE|nr:hypothetical protein CRE_14763 [Caenorhabditis remanei]
MENQAKAFPILRLPIIVIQEVVSMMNPFEILHFSLISRIAKLIGQMCWRNSRHIDYRFDVEISEEPFIAFTKGERRWVYEITTEMDKSDQRRNWTDIELQYKYYENPIGGLKTWIQVVQKTLKATLQYIRINIDDYPTQNRVLIDWIKTQTSSVEKFVIDGSKLADDDVTYFLNTITAKWGLCLDTKLSDQFTINFSRALAAFYVHHGEWITVVQLLLIPALSISIVHSSLTPQELKVFFELWMDSKYHEKLRYFDIVLKSEQHLEAIASLPHTPIDKEGSWYLDTWFYKDMVQAGVEITRNDGATAFLGWFESPHSEFGLIRFCLYSNELNNALTA